MAHGLFIFTFLISYYIRSTIDSVLCCYTTRNTTTSSYYYYLLTETNCAHFSRNSNIFKPLIFTKQSSVCATVAVSLALSRFVHSPIDGDRDGKWSAVVYTTTVYVLRPFVSINNLSIRCSCHSMFRTVRYRKSKNYVKSYLFI